MKHYFSPLLTLVLLTTSLNAAELSGKLSVVSDYRLRGISQSAGSEAIQGGVEAHFGTGSFVGVYASNIDLGNNSNLELDYYLGYADNLNAELSYAVTLSYFTFQGHEAANTNFFEGSVSLYYDRFTLNYTATDNTINSSERSEHIALTYQYPLTNNLKLALHAEHNFGEFYGSYDINDYQNYEVALTSQLAGLEVSAKYIIVGTDKQDDISEGLFRNDDTFVISVGKTF